MYRPALSVKDVIVNIFHQGYQHFINKVFVFLIDFINGLNFYYYCCRFNLLVIKNNIYIMKIRTCFFIIVCVLLICSCKSTKMTTQRTLPLSREENSRTEVTVRTESVKPIDPSEKIIYEFYVIIGSFRSIENAQQYNIDLVRKGFIPVILENEDGLFRISVGGYNDENAARARIASIRATYEDHKDVWLLVRKK